MTSIYFKLVAVPTRKSVFNRMASIFRMPQNADAGSQPTLPRIFGPQVELKRNDDYVLNRNVVLEALKTCDLDDVPAVLAPFDEPFLLHLMNDLLAEESMNGGNNTFLRGNTPTSRLFGFFVNKAFKSWVDEQFSSGKKSPPIDVGIKKVATLLDQGEFDRLLGWVNGKDDPQFSVFVGAIFLRSVTPKYTNLAVCKELTSIANQVSSGKAPVVKPKRLRKSLSNLDSAIAKTRRSISVPLPVTKSAPDVLRLAQSEPEPTSPSPSPFMPVHGSASGSTQTSTSISSGYSSPFEEEHATCV